MRNGLLMVLMEPPPAMEEEFNAWYDTEHLPERVTLPGFLNGARYVCVDGHPRYMAIYDLESEAVLDSAEYLTISGSRFSPWTKRVTSRMPVYRVAATQIFPGDDTLVRSPRLMVVKVRDAGSIGDQQVLAALRDILSPVTEITQMRLFATGGARTDYFAIIGLLGTPGTAPALSKAGVIAGHLDMINVYAPYNPAI